MSWRAHARKGRRPLWTSSLLTQGVLYALAIMLCAPSCLARSHQASAYVTPGAYAGPCRPRGLQARVLGLRGVRPCRVAGRLSMCSSAVPVTGDAVQQSAEEGAEKDKPLPVPTLGDLLGFTLPTLGIWLAGPIMSLVDTSVVGLHDPTGLELAAMGPATNTCDTFLYLFAFLAVALAEGDEKKSQTVVSHALAISLAAGMGVWAVIAFFGRAILSNTIGADGPLLVPISLKYTSLRAAGAPAVILGMVAQAALLGARDSWTPLVVTIAGAAVNLVGDVLLVNVLAQGISGAALATILAEIAGAVVLLSALKKSQGTKRFYPFIKLPSVKELGNFLKFAGPIFFALVGKTVCYSTLGFTAQMFGAIPLAAHQVMLRCFFLFTCLGDSLSTTAQAFLPGLLVTRNAVAVKTIIRRLLLLSVGMGLFNAVLSWLIPFHLPQLFTASTAIAAEMRNLAPFLSCSLLVHACTMALEGILLAERELRYLAVSYAVNTVAVCGGLLTMRWLGLGSIGGVWAWLVFFQASRMTQFGLRIIAKHRARGGLRIGRLVLGSWGGASEGYEKVPVAGAEGS